MNLKLNIDEAYHLEFLLDRALCFDPDTDIEEKDTSYDILQTLKKIIKKNENN